MSTAILVRDLEIAYRGRVVLRGVDLDLPAGEISAIVGPSGCGKTSVLAAMNRMTDLVEDCRVRGQIRIGELEVLERDCDPQRLRRRVGMIFQRPAPFRLSVRENVELALRDHGFDAVSERAEQALRDVGLWEELADRLETSALELSGGQQQRLCLARAIALEPEVLLLDEPCSALDPLSTAVVEDLVRSLKGRYTIAIVTHNLAQARRLADGVAVFWTEGSVGTVVERGPVEAIFASPQHAATRAYVAGLQG